MKYALFLLIGSFVIFSCAKDKCHFDDATFTRISQGALYGAGEENIAASNHVIRTQEEWNELVGKMNTTNNVSADFSVSELNFSEKMVIACFDEIRPNGGHSITITAVTHTGNEIIVAVNNALPTTENTTTVITQPYDLVLVDRCENDVIFE
jgi:hypothetical protein